jgi:hypothetical protein
VQAVDTVEVGVTTRIQTQTRTMGSLGFIGGGTEALSESNSAEAETRGTDKATMEAEGVKEKET